MLSLRWKFGALLAFLLAGSAWGQATYNCLPTCDATDARFLAIATGAAWSRLASPRSIFELAVPKGTTTFTVGVFDGDAKGIDGAGISHWDTSSPRPSATPSTPTRTATCGGGSRYRCSGQPRSALDHDAGQRLDRLRGQYRSSRSGTERQLLLSATDRAPTPTALTTPNAFKVRTRRDRWWILTLPIAAAVLIYRELTRQSRISRSSIPAIPLGDPTRYDGTFDFYFDKPVSQRDITVWDGDFDHGKFDGTDKDTDDPDTPNAPFLPSWATPRYGSRRSCRRNWRQHGQSIRTTATRPAPASTTRSRRPYGID